MASLIGQDVSNGLIAETDKEAAQRFISQQIFSVPDGHSQTQVLLETLGLRFRHNDAGVTYVQLWSTSVLLLSNMKFKCVKLCLLSLSNKRKQPRHRSLTLLFWLTAQKGTCLLSWSKALEPVGEVSVVEDLWLLRVGEPSHHQFFQASLGGLHVEVNTHDLFLPQCLTEDWHSRLNTPAVCECSERKLSHLIWLWQMLISLVWTVRLLPDTTTFHHTAGSFSYVCSWSQIQRQWLQFNLICCVILFLISVSEAVLWQSQWVSSPLQAPKSNKIRQFWAETDQTKFNWT